MADELSRLSPEQINKLAKTINEAKNLTARQAEIINRVIQGETEIGELRISYLNQYFDIYSKSLDAIIARKKSDLADAFLVAEQALEKASKKKQSDDKKIPDKVSTVNSSNVIDSNGIINTKVIEQNLDSLNKTTKSIHGQLAEVLRRLSVTSNNNIANGYANSKGSAQNLSNYSSTGAQVTAFKSTEASRPQEPSETGQVTVDASAAVVNHNITARNELSEQAIHALNAQSIAFTDFADAFSIFTQLTPEEQSNQIESNTGNLNDYFNTEAILIERQKQEESLQREHSARISSIIENRLALEVARHLETEENKTLLEEQLTELRLARASDAVEAELSAQNLINSLKNNAAVVLNDDAGESGTYRAQKVNAEEEEKTAKAIQARVIKFKEQEEARSRARNNGKLLKEEAERIEKLAAIKLEAELENIEELTEARAKKELLDTGKANRKEFDSIITAPLSQENNLVQRFKDIKNFGHDPDDPTDKDSFGAALLKTTAILSDMAQQLEAKIDEIASHKGAIDTRLQGSNNKKFMGSYWDQLVRDMTSVGAVNPFFKQENFAKNIESLVDRGIAFDLKQRAFLMTIQDKIAKTFEVADGTLLRLVRIQQEDSTAGRLGMESALNSFLNNMYETSEYLSTVASSVRHSLEEMESLMQGAEAAEVEYQVQKWLGSLYSVGMSDTAVNSISNALGQIASGQVEGLTGSGASNLLIMAANDAGLSIADILTDGLDASDTNKLLQASVNYLAELAESSKDNQIVQQQLANVFGVKASDLRAATNLTSSVNSVYGSQMTYENMLGQLSSMASSMWQRTSIAEMMSNIWENGQYTLASGMASNPVSYLIYKMAKVLDNAAGGIDLPFLNVMGFGVDLNTTVSDLMRVAAVGSGVLGMLGPMFSGLGSSFSGAAMLKKLDIGTGSGLAITPRGDGGGLLSATGGGAQSTSGSGYVGNSSGSDVKDSTIQESEDSKKQQMIEAKEEAEENQVDILNTTVLKIYELLDDVARGKSTFKVKVEDYGLTKAGGAGTTLNRSNSSSGATIGNGFKNTALGSSSSNDNSLNSSSTLGGWTTI